MKFSRSKQQRGAILAFSLVMLLLLTLAGTRMIQQNKQQLQMAGNVRLLTQAFADTEAVLANAKNIINTYPSHDNYLSDDYFPIDSKLLIYNNAHQCTPTASYKQQIDLAGVIDGGIISSVACLSPYQQCTSYDKTTATLTCHPKSGDVNCTGKTIEEVAALFSDTANYCYQPYDPLCANPDASNSNPNPRCRSEPPAILPSPACPKEVYKIDVISTANGTSREIISDHVIGCGT